MKEQGLHPKLSTQIKNAYVEGVGENTFFVLKPFVPVHTASSGPTK